MLIIFRKVLKFSELPRLQGSFFIIGEIEIFLIEVTLEVFNYQKWGEKLLKNIRILYLV